SILSVLEPRVNAIVPAVDVIVANAGAADVPPIRTWPLVPAVVAVTADRVLPKRTPFAVNVVAPVPPPATTAVPKVGLADEPADIKGTPEVAEGATFDRVLVAEPPTMTLYCVAVVAVKAEPENPTMPVVVAFILLATAILFLII
ncbi:MAG: hypothetical protein ACRDL7_12815, partial [Gaiellaceae bacterium]